MKHLKISLKLLVLLMAIGFMVAGCQKDDIKEVNNLTIDHQKESITHFSIGDLPQMELVLNQLSTNSNYRTTNSTFGDLNLSDILQYINGDGKETYTFKILNSQNRQSIYEFENLHFVKLPDNAGYLSYITHWIPGLYQIDSNTYDFSIETFTGTMKRYDLNYDLLDITVFENGQIINPSNTSGRYASSCQIHTYSVCEGDCTCNSTCYDVVEISCNDNSSGGDSGEGGSDQGGSGTPIGNDNPNGSGGSGGYGPGQYVPGGNGNVAVSPLTIIEMLENFFDLTPQQTIWANKENNKQKAIELMTFVLLNCGGTNSNVENCETAQTIAEDILNILTTNPNLSFEEATLLYATNNNLPLVYNPNNPIVDVQEFLECFDVTQNATLTIYALEPDPGTGDTHNGTFVGHTFISISQGSNTSTYGYYPVEDDIYPFFNESSVAVLGDDGSGNEPYTVSLTKTINGAQLQQIINKSINFNSTYHLDNYNCTDFALEIGNTVGFNLPSCNGTWTGGGGSNPGTLGMEIRNRTLQPGETKNTTGGNASATQKNC